MSLEVIVASASNLPNLETLGKIDPYVSVEYQGNDLCNGPVCSALCGCLSTLRYTLSSVSCLYHIYLIGYIAHNVQNASLSSLITGSLFHHTLETSVLYSFLSRSRCTIGLSFILQLRQDHNY